jgi:hypothetical protein
VATDRLAALLADDYLAGLSELDLDAVREKRAACQEVEVALSYLRRVAQGRLDIVLAELDRRAGGGPADLAALVERLPEILSERVRAPGLGRLPTLMAPDLEVLDVAAELDAVADPTRLADLADLDDAAVRTLAERLEQVEARLSADRRALHERIDRIQEEIVRRYKSGEASVEHLLR